MATILKKLSSAEQAVEQALKNSGVKMSLHEIAVASGQNRALALRYLQRGLTGKNPTIRFSQPDLYEYVGSGSKQVVTNDVSVSSTYINTQTPVDVAGLTSPSDAVEAHVSGAEPHVSNESVLAVAKFVQGAGLCLKDHAKDKLGLDDINFQAAITHLSRSEALEIRDVPNMPGPLLVAKDKLKDFLADASSTTPAPDAQRMYKAELVAKLASYVFEKERAAESEMIQSLAISKEEYDMAIAVLRRENAVEVTKWEAFDEDIVSNAGTLDSYIQPRPELIIEEDPAPKVIPAQPLNADMAAGAVAGTVRAGKRPHLTRGKKRQDPTSMIDEKILSFLKGKAETLSAIGWGLVDDQELRSLGKIGRPRIQNRVKQLVEQGDLQMTMKGKKEVYALKGFILPSSVREPRAGKKAAKAKRQESKGVTVTTADRLLAYLAAHPGQAFYGTQLANALSISTATASRVARECIELGKVEILPLSHPPAYVIASGESSEQGAPGAISVDSLLPSAKPRSPVTTQGQSTLLSVESLLPILVEDKPATDAAVSTLAKKPKLTKSVVEAKTPQQTASSQSKAGGAAAKEKLNEPLNGRGNGGPLDIPVDGAEEKRAAVNPPVSSDVQAEGREVVSGLAALGADPAWIEKLRLFVDQIGAIHQTLIELLPEKK